MLTTRDIYHLLGRMLSRGYSEKDTWGAMLPATEEEWQQWVSLGSNHYILPAVYAKIASHEELCALFPPELLQTLKSIYDLNLKRNLNNIGQMTFLRDLFTKEEIPHLFMKGSGHLADGLYDSPAERMMLDIDLLVYPADFLKAAELCKENGYLQFRSFNKKGLLSARHYSLLAKEGFACSLEIHQMPVDILMVKHFDADLVFRDSLITQGPYPGFRVMSDPHKAIHNFIHCQLMNLGYYTGSVPLRDAYDLYQLDQRSDVPEAFLSHNKWKNKSIPYYGMMKHLFHQPLPEDLKKYSFHDKTIKRNESFLQLPPQKRRKRLQLYSFWQKYIVLPFSALTNKYARNYITSRIFRLSWYQLRLKLLFSGKH